MLRKRVKSQKDAKGIRLKAFVMFLLGGILFTGCGKTTSKQGTDIQKSTQNVQQERSSEFAQTSIAYQEWNIKSRPVEGTTNLYELKLDTLNDNESWIVSLKPYGQYFLVLKEYVKAGCYLYMVDPLMAEVKAVAELPAGNYGSNGLYVNSSKMIEVINHQNNEVYLFDDTLQKQKEILLDGIETEQLVLTDDLNYIYYMNNIDGELYQYDVNGEISSCLLETVREKKSNQGEVIGLLEHDSCLLYNYYDEEQKSLIYEVRNIFTSEMLYQDTAQLEVVETNGDTYILRHEENGINEILYGNSQEINVLALKDYNEYDQVSASISQRSVVSAWVKENARKEYDQLGKEKLEDFAQVTKLSLNHYSLEDGRKKHTVNYYYLHDEHTSIKHCEGIYLKEADCVVCFIDGSQKQFLVWDLTVKESEVLEEKTYAYSWQNPDEPDKEALTALQERAKEIGNHYGVDIHLGEEIAECPRDIYTYLVCNNAIRIERALEILEKALGKYPDGMLGQLEDDEGGRLQIYLSGEILPTDEVALDTSVGIQNTIDEVTFLVLDVNQFRDFENTIYHEIFHSIEKHLLSQSEEFFAQEEWEKLNPEGFDYDYDYQKNAKNSNYDYTIGSIDSEVYFVDPYAKSFPNEDRARIMEYAMLDLTDERRSNIEAEKIKVKLQYICEQLRKGFDTTGWPKKTIWEQALENE